MSIDDVMAQQRLITDGRLYMSPLGWITGGIGIGPE